MSAEDRVLRTSSPRFNAIPKDLAQRMLARCDELSTAIERLSNEALAVGGCRTDRHGDTHRTTLVEVGSRT